MPYLIIQSQDKPNAAIQILNKLFSKLTGKNLTDHDSHRKDSISFIDIRNMMRRKC